MAGIFGIQDYTGASDIGTAMEQLRRAAKQGYEMPSGEQRFPNGGLGFAFPAHYSDTVWPLISRDSKYALVVFGDVYVPSGSPLREYNFESDFLQPFLSSKDEFLRELDGAFVLALMSDDECWLVNDPFGNFALHYQWTPERFIFSTQAEGIRSVTGDRGFDERSMLEYLGLTFPLQGRTIFEGMSRLPAGTTLHASKTGIELHRYYRPAYNAEYANVARNIEGIRRAFETSVLRQSSYKDAAIALSGGFDSRATWSVALKNRLPSTAYTHGLQISSDIEIAQRIAQRFNLNHHLLHFDSDFLEDMPTYWREIVRLSEGGTSIILAPILKVWSMLKGRYSVLVDSYGGTFYRRQRLKVAERLIDRNKDLIPQLLRWEASPLLTSGLLRAEVHQNVRDASMDALRSYYESIDSVSKLGDKLDLFHLEQVDAMKDSLQGNAQMNFIGLAHPFLTLPALELVSKVPVPVRRRNAIHRNIVHQSFPELEAIPLDNVGFRVPYRGFSLLRYAPMAVERGLRALNPLLRPSQPISLRRPTMDLEYILRPGQSQIKEILLDGNQEFERFIDRPRLEQELYRFETRQSSGAVLPQLLTFRLFLDLFAQ